MAFKVIAIVGARLNSSRLPKKHLLDLAGKPLIAHIFERLETVKELAHVVLATTDDAYNKPLMDWAKSQNKEAIAYQGDVNDVVGRVDAIVEMYRPDAFFYVCGDSPLVEPATFTLMVNVLKKRPTADMVLISPKYGKRVIHEGFDLYTYPFWKRVVAASCESEEREHLGYSRRKLDYDPIECEDEPIFYQLSHRLSVDTPSDYRFMTDIYQRWQKNYPQTSQVSLRWVIEQLQNDSHLRQVNQSVKQKTAWEHSAPILLVTAVGPDIGLGHLRRILVAAKALQDRESAAVQLLILGAPWRHPDLVLLPHYFCTEQAFVDALRSMISSKKFFALVLDLPHRYLSDEACQFLDVLRRDHVRLVSIDFSLPPQACDLNWVPSFFMAPSQRTEMKNRFGWDTLLLPQTQPRSLWKPNSRLLVLAGGSDPFDWASHLAPDLDRTLPKETQIIWVQGPFAAPPTLPDEPRLAWDVYCNPENLENLMRTCSYGLVLYGVSFFECLHEGLACVVVTSNVNLEERLSLEAANVACVIKNHRLAAREVQALIQNETRSRAFCQKALQLLDGQGACRLAKAIVTLEPMS